MLMKIFAAVFAVYECYKMLHAGAYIAVIKKAKTAHTPGETASLLADPFLRKILLIEIAYIIFAIVLLFTAYWYFTVILFSISLFLFALNPEGRLIHLLLITGSAVCAIILLTIIWA